MKKTQKGVTLVEVLVSIAVFAIISLTLFSSVIAMKNVIHRQEEYVKIEMVCYDMNAYCTVYGSEWQSKYFSGQANNNEGYLSSDFKPINSDNAAYIIEFGDSYDVIVSISSIDRKTVFVENLTLSK